MRKVYELNGTVNSMQKLHSLRPWMEEEVAKGIKQPFRKVNLTNVIYDSKNDVYSFTMEFFS